MSKIEIVHFRIINLLPLLFEQKCIANAIEQFL